jgi:succinylarginine dihydrolase
VVDEQWPERIAPEDLLNPQLWEQVEEARETLLERLDLGELV